jgi:hypothetical protein
MKLVYLLLFSVLLSRSSEAQGSSVGVPVLGFAFDSSRGAIRPVRGIPGAAMLGDPLDPGFPLASAVIAPQQNFALAFSTGEQPRIVSWSDGKLSTLSLADTMAAPDRMIFSPSGTAAILLSSQSPARLQILTGLPRPSAVEEINIRMLTRPLGSAAVSDDGKLVILADGGQNPAWLFNSARSQVMLPLSGPGAVFAFRRDSHDAAAMASTGDVYVLQNLDDAPALRNISPGGDQTAGAVGLWFSADGTQVYAASSGGNIAAVDFTTGATQSVACQCVPTGIQPLRPGIFRLTDISNRPVLVFDASAPAPRVWFVPPDRPQPELAGGGQ